MDTVFALIIAMFAAMCLRDLFYLRWAKRLPALSPASGALVPIRCSIIIAARNEANRIEQTIRRLLVQQGVNLDIIVVDDRSSDGTGRLLEQLAKEDSRLRTVRVNELPPGWLGKCHACHLGAALATGDWILFTDADCWLKPDVLARALQVAERDGVEHVTLTPGIKCERLRVRAWYLMYSISLLDWMAGVNRNRPKSYMGIGAFNLVRTSAYRACGGYEALKLTIVDDVMLGLLLCRAGKRTRAFLGAEDVECHWGTTLREVMRVNEKNYFAILNFRLWLVILGSFPIFVLIVLVGMGLVSGRAVGLAAGVAPLLLIGPAMILARRLGWSKRSAFGIPLMIPVFLMAVLNSTSVTVRQGGVRWRETFYSTAELRAGGVK